jgi:hypothetical protein
MLRRLEPVTKEIPAFGLVSSSPRRLVARGSLAKLVCAPLVFGVVAAVQGSNSGLRYSTTQYQNVEYRHGEDGRHASVA